ncbi:MAG TPA: response regulator [Thermodesulfobacteriota bacterium]|nr:response regulator [Thermodesulfobacteriota bacterium]
MHNVFYSLKISKKIGAIFGLLLLMMGLGGAFGLYNAISIVNVAEQMYKNNFQRSEILSAVEKELLIQHQELFLHVISSDRGVKDFFDKSIIQRMDKVNSLILEYGAYGLREDTEKLLDEFAKETILYWDVQMRVLNLSNEGKSEKAKALAGDEGKRQFNASMHSLKGLFKEERLAAAAAYQESQNLGRDITVLTGAFTLLAIMLAGGLWTVLSRSIIKPILDIEEASKRVAHGDFSRPASVMSRDEIGELALEFNKMAERLEEYYSALGKKVEDRTEELMAANSELSQKKAELEDKNEELSRVNRMKTLFLANVSHELRTPLNSIIGFSELLQEKSFGELNEKQTQYSKFIHASGTHLLHLINSILDLSKIEAGRMDLAKEKFSVSELIGDAVGSVRPIAHKRNIGIDVKETRASIMITADRSKLKQVMLNLLSNAVKFNVEDGKVIVDWGVKEEPKGMTVGKSFYIEVTDTGMGIKEEDIKRLFTEFEQLDASITREHGGTGLGLALTKKLVELHGGNIRVESEHGKGCKFIVTVPQEPGEVEVASLNPEPVVFVSNVMEASRPVILVASESDGLNHLLKVYLSGDRYDVIMANDGPELLRKAKEQKPFSIVMGIRLRKMDGWEVLKELKRGAETRDIPVVIVSATNDKELGFALGAVDYLEKPVDKTRLLQTLGRLSFTTKTKSQKMTILAVDDEPQVLALMGDILEKEGFSVIKASDGKTAVKMIVEQHPDLVILDLMMPGMSGFDVCDRLKEYHEAKDIPIIIFTAKEITAEDKERLGTGIKKIIKKASFSKEDLLSEIRLLELFYPERANLVDRTTKLFNRRFFDISLARELSRCERYGHTFSLMFVDIDGFNDFNRSNGAVRGDEALAEVARLLAHNLRKADYVTRYGGDEFAVILPGIDVEEAGKVAEKIRVAVEGCEFFSGSGGLTASIGVCGVKTRATSSVVDELKDKVRALYEHGGNAVKILEV